ncbi:MAG: micrococcal nuclease [Spirochaetaceae bacterium]|nr:MAG: micrococcal nuclease [Spirochaetaceae bacterium]
MRSRLMMMMKRRALPAGVLALLLLLAGPVAVTAQIVFEGTVTRITDGDSVTLQTGTVSYRARLHGIDAPESNQPWGTEATAALRRIMPVGSRVRVVVPDIDRYGRLIVRLYVDAGEVNVLMLEAGAAWHYTQFDQSDTYAEAEARARQNRRGLWAHDTPIPPWDWRRGER